MQDEKGEKEVPQVAGVMLAQNAVLTLGVKQWWRRVLGSPSVLVGLSVALGLALVSAHWEIQSLNRENIKLSNLVELLRRDNEQLRMQLTILSLQLAGQKPSPSGEIIPPTTGPIPEGSQWATPSDRHPRNDVKIQFETVPSAGAGPDSRGGISGHVIGLPNPARYKVVLYAHTDHWYVQPTIAQPLTEIAQDGRWSNWTHLGDRFAALVVEPSFRPPSIAEALPATGGEVLSVGTVSAELK